MSNLSAPGWERDERVSELLAENARLRQQHLDETVARHTQLLATQQALQDERASVRFLMDKIERVEALADSWVKVGVGQLNGNVAYSFGRLLQDALKNPYLRDGVTNG